MSKDIHTNLIISYIHNILRFFCICFTIVYDSRTRNFFQHGVRISTVLEIQTCAHKYRARDTNAMFHT
jgi:hypothetical protein